MNLRYPAYLYPAVPIPPPPIAPLRGRLDGRVVTWTFDRELGDRQLPTEFVLQELWDLDLPGPGIEVTGDDARTIVDFCNRFGPLPRPFHPPADHVAGGDGPGLVVPAAGVTTVEDAQQWLLTLQASAQYLADGASGTEDQHRLHLEVLDLGLSSCPWGAGPLEGPSTPSSDLFTAAALMLHGMTVGPDPVRRCAHATCGRPFVHQRVPGDDHRGHLRTKGVMFCTPRCARAAAQRAYRQRSRKTDAGTVTPTADTGTSDTEQGQQ